MTADVLSKVPTDLFIGGTWRAASEGGRFDVTDPATGDVIAQVADGSVDDGLAAVAAAAEAGPGWAATPPRQRAEILRKAWQLMTDRVDEIATLISLENGKALVDAKGEAAYAAEFFRWYSEETVRIDGLVTTAPGGANRIMVVHQPVGVCVMVTPWNFPAAMATRKIGPALGAGCTVVLKPASDTPLTALLMAQILDDAGVPAGVVNVVPSRRSGAIVSAMVHDDRVRKLSFTGSTEVGRVLLKEAADTVVNTSMELGGNAPFLVFADADLDAALEGAMIAKMRNGGEACTAANRFYVEESVAEEFAAPAGREDGRDEGRPRHRGRHPGRAAGQRRGRCRSATSWCAEPWPPAPRPSSAGRCPTGRAATTTRRCWSTCPPTPRSCARRSSDRSRRSSPSPTRQRRCATPTTPSSAWSPISTPATWLAGCGSARRWRAGMIGLNRGLVSDPAAPFGGVKQSGIGREGGHEGLLDYTESKYIALSW